MAPKDLNQNQEEELVQLAQATTNEPTPEETNADETEIEESTESDLPSDFQTQLIEQLKKQGLTDQQITGVTSSLREYAQENGVEITSIDTASFAVEVANNISPDGTIEFNSVVSSAVETVTSPTFEPTQTSETSNTDTLSGRASERTENSSSIPTREAPTSQINESDDIVNARPDVQPVKAVLTISNNTSLNFNSGDLNSTGDSKFLITDNTININSVEGQNSLTTYASNTNNNLRGNLVKTESSPKREESTEEESITTQSSKSSSSYSPKFFSIDPYKHFYLENYTYGKNKPLFFDFKIDSDNETDRLLIKGGTISETTVFKLDDTTGEYNKFKSLKKEVGDNVYLWNLQSGDYRITMGYDGFWSDETTGDISIFVDAAVKQTDDNFVIRGTISDYVYNKYLGYDVDPRNIDDFVNFEPTSGLTHYRIKVEEPSSHIYQDELTVSIYDAYNKIVETQFDKLSSNPFFFIKSPNNSDFNLDISYTGDNFKETSTDYIFPYHIELVEQSLPDVLFSIGDQKFKISDISQTELPQITSLNSNTTNLDHNIGGDLLGSYLALKEVLSFDTNFYLGQQNQIIDETNFSIGAEKFFEYVGAIGAIGVGAAAVALSGGALLPVVLAGAAAGSSIGLNINQLNRIEYLESIAAERVGQGLAMLEEHFKPLQEKLLNSYLSRETIDATGAGNLKDENVNLNEIHQALFWLRTGTDFLQTGISLLQSAQDDYAAPDAFWDKVVKPNALNVVGAGAAGLANWLPKLSSLSKLGVTEQNAGTFFDVIVSGGIAADNFTTAFLSDDSDIKNIANSANAFLDKWSLLNSTLGYYSIERQESLNHLFFEKYSDGNLGITSQHNPPEILVSLENNKYAEGNVGEYIKVYPEITLTHPHFKDLYIKAKLLDQNDNTVLTGSAHIHSGSYGNLAIPFQLEGNNFKDGIKDYKIIFTAYEGDDSTPKSEWNLYKNINTQEAEFSIITPDIEEQWVFDNTQLEKGTQLIEFNGKESNNGILSPENRLREFTFEIGEDSEVRLDAWWGIGPLSLKIGQQFKLKLYDGVGNEITPNGYGEIEPTATFLGKNLSKGWYKAVVEYLGDQEISFNLEISIKNNSSVSNTGPILETDYNLFSDISFLNRAVYGGEEVLPEEYLSSKSDELNLFDSYKAYIANNGFGFVTPSSILEEPNKLHEPFLDGGKYKDENYFYDDVLYRNTKVYDLSGGHEPSSSGAIALVSTKRLSDIYNDASYGYRLYLTLRGTDADFGTDGEAATRSGQERYYKQLKPILDGIYDLASNPFQGMQELVISGHSLGGAMAEIIALMEGPRFETLKQNGILRDFKIVSIAPAGIDNQFLLNHAHESDLIDSKSDYTTGTKTISIQTPEYYQQFSNSKDIVPNPHLLDMNKPDVGFATKNGSYLLGDNTHISGNSITFNHVNLDQYVLMAEAGGNYASMFLAEHNEGLYEKAITVFSETAKLAQITNPFEYNILVGNGFSQWYLSDWGLNVHDTKGLESSVGKDLILGLEGDDILTGNSGDVLSGGLGNDLFRIKSNLSRLIQSEETITSNQITITDYDNEILDFIDGRNFEYHYETFEFVNSVLDTIEQIQNDSLLSSRLVHFSDGQDSYLFKSAEEKSSDGYLVKLIGLTNRPDITKLTSIIESNLPPVANSTKLFKVRDDQTLTLLISDLLDGVEDPEDDTLSIKAIETSFGFIEPDEETGNYTYIPNASGVAELSYIVSDGINEITVENQISVMTTSTPEVVVSNASAYEGDTIEFKVSLSSPSVKDVTLNYHLKGQRTAWHGTVYNDWGTADSRDFEMYGGLNREITIKSGETEGYIRIPTKSDGAVENNEWFTMLFDRLDNATWGQPTKSHHHYNHSSAWAWECEGPEIRGTVLDTTTRVKLSKNDIVVTEGDKVLVEVVKTGPKNEAVTVAYSVNQGTATVGRDYKSIYSGTVSFTEDQTTALIEIQTYNDYYKEPTQTFDITLDSVDVGVISGNKKASIQIYDDNDPRPYGGPQIISETILSDGRELFASDPYVQQLNDGKVLFVWNQTVYDDGETPYYLVPNDIHAYIYSEYGQLLKKHQFRITGDQIRPSIEPLDDHLVIYWNHDNGPGWDIYAQKMDYDGNLLGNRYKTQKDFVGNTYQYDENSAGLSKYYLKDGGYIEASTKKGSGGWDSEIVFSIYDDNDNIIHSGTALEHIDGNVVASPVVTELNNGNFVIGWAETLNWKGYYLYGRQFSSDGSALGDKFMVTPSYYRDSWYLRFSPYDDDGFIATWTRWGDVYTQVFNGSNSKRKFTLNDPLLLDLNENGFDLSESSMFDLNADGKADKSSWTSDGILAIDRNENGIIDDMTELFSERMFENISTGLDALATFDINSDNIIDSNDEIWTDLKVWQDANADGITDEGELFTMADLEISSINLKATPSVEDVEGGMILSRGSFTYEDGSEGEFAEVAFEVVEDEQQPIQEVA